MTDTDSQPRMIQCPMHDWEQVSPNRETSINLLVRHGWDAHTVGPNGPPPWVVARMDVALAEAGCPYVQPDGRWVP